MLRGLRCIASCPSCDNRNRRHRHSHRRPLSLIYDLRKVIRQCTAKRAFALDYADPAIQSYSKPLARRNHVFIRKSLKQTQLSKRCHETYNTR